jgi:hypothetical protein
MPRAITVITIKVREYILFLCVFCFEHFGVKCLYVVSWGCYYSDKNQGAFFSLNLYFIVANLCLSVYICKFVNLWKCFTFKQFSSRVAFNYKRFAICLHIMFVKDTLVWEFLHFLII